jgi:exopolysaccharide biosynthesis polyprenyl glycosylphosphotransferase
MWRTQKERMVSVGGPVLGASIATGGLLMLLLVSDPFRGAFTEASGQVLAGALGVLIVALAVKASRPPRRNGAESVLILGNGQIAGELRRDLAAVRELDERSSTPAILDPSIGKEGAERLKELIVNERISDVVITDHGIGTHADITALLIECKFRGVRISRAPEFYEGIHKKVWLEALRPEAFVYSDAINPSPVYLAMKRALDLVCAIAVFVLTLPLMLLIAIAIKLDSPGPVLFRQERLGRFGEPFMLYKFRSMRSGAEKDVGPMWAQVNDDRVTRVGRILRRTHLDELPQVFNVLRNELSFVGPRPERECFVQALEKRIPYFRLREYIKPGITGWAQVSAAYGDSVLASAEKLRYDLYYAKHASMRFDLKILFQTVWHVALGRGR